MRLRHVIGAIGLALALGGVLEAAGREGSLVDAVKRADKEAIGTLLKTVDVNAPDADGSTALHWAVHHDDADTVRQLIGAGANVNAENRYKVRPLELGCTLGNAQVIEMLLSAGADPKARLSAGETPLMVAARTGRVDAVKVLVKHGADPNVRDEVRGQTPLMWAAAEGNADAVKALLEAGADRTARTGKSAPADQPVASSTGVFSQATRYAGQTGGQMGFTALLFAAQLGQIDAARVLLDNGADANEALLTGMSALVLAAMNGNYEFASFLLERGANPNASDQGWTALHQIARARRTNIGFLPTPAVNVGKVGSLELAKTLIAKGADVNAKMTKDFRDGYRNRLNRVGATPFLLAAKNTDTELMRVLLEHGADPLLANADGTTPIMVAAGVDIWNPGEDGGTGPGSEAEALEAVKMLFERGGDIHATNANGENALHGAAYRGANSIVQFLLDKGAKLDVRNNEGWTPWTIANGVFYSLFFKEQRDTANFLGKLMADRGISTEGMASDALSCSHCARGDQRFDATGTYKKAYELKPAGATPDPAKKPNN